MSRPRRTFGTLATLLLAATPVCLTSLVFPGVAGATPAVGNEPNLSSYIVPNPEPGWTPASASAISQITEHLEKVDSNAVNGSTVTVAANAWLDPDGSGFLAITLSQWPSNLSNWSQVMHEGFEDECVGVTGNNPSSVISAPNLSGSLSTLCTSGDGMTQLAATMVRKGYIVEMIESIGMNASTPISLPGVDSIAASQYALLPAAPGTNPFQAAVGAAVLAGLIAGAVILVRRLKRGHKAPSVHGLEFTLSSPGATGISPSPWPTRPAPQPVSVYVPRGSPISTGQPDSAPRDLPTLNDFFAAQARGDTDSVVETRPVPAPANPAPAVTTRTVGWHSEGDNPFLQRYWNGTSWVGRIRWDGKEWKVVDAVVVRPSALR
jgi:hypothetical protein